MRIIELNIIEFGCLKNVRLELDSGLNVISGDNESGKSTVMLFIRFMLYGLPRRSSKCADRERCLSFDGHRAAGSMTFESDGVEYRIERRASGVGRISEALSFVSLRTGENISGEPGEVILGVPVEVFESSCSVGQMRAADISKAQATGAIENMMVSADESIDVKKAIDRIDKIRKEYRPLRGDGGILSKNESEISALKIKRKTATEKYLRFNETKERLERKERELEEVERELERAERRSELIRCAQILERFDKNENAKRELEERKAQLVKLDGEFGGFVPSAAHSSALCSAIDAYEAATLKKEQRNVHYNEALNSSELDVELVALGEKAEKAGGAAEIIRIAERSNRARVRRIACGISLLCLAGVLGIISALLPFPILIALACASAAAIVGGVLLMASGVSAKRRRDSLCAEYGVRYDDIEARLKRCTEELRKRERIQDEIISSKARLEDAAEDENQCREKLARLVGLTCKTENAEGETLTLAAKKERGRVESFCKEREQRVKEIYALDALVKNDEEYLSDYNREELACRIGSEEVSTDAQAVSNAERALSFSRAKHRSLSPEILSLRETLAGLKAGLQDDPAELGDKIAELEKKNERDNEYFEALMLAKESIEQASTSMSGNFTPEISRRAGELLAKISGGRHAALQTTKTLEMSVEEDGFSVPVDAVSGGTRDAAYVALRIALMFRLYGDKLPPMLLDETLCQLDDSRAAAVLEILDSFSRMNMQTLLFTCHERESNICQKNGYKINEIKI